MSATFEEEIRTVNARLLVLAERRTTGSFILRLKDGRIMQMETTEVQKVL